MMRSPFLFIISLLCLLCFPTEVWADKICGRVLAPNGLNVREKPSLDSKVLHVLAQGDTFAYFSDGETGIFQTLTDGSETVRGEWVEIILYPKLDGSFETEAIGYLFYAETYTSYIDCEHFRHRLYAKDLYENTDTAATAKAKAALQIDFIPATTFAKHFKTATAQFIQQKQLYQLRGDTILLRTKAKQPWYPVVSYPFGKNGNEDFREVYEYLGYHAQLDKHLVAGSYWESGDYLFVDTEAEEMQARCLGYPSVSPGSKHIMSLAADFEDLAGSYLALFAVENDKIKAIFAFSFKNWVYADQVVWIDDRTILIKVSSARADQPIVVYVEEAKNVVPPSEGKRFHYLKISIR